MEIVKVILGVAVYLAIPTLIYVHIMKKAEKSTRVYSPDEVTERLRKGFYLFTWGTEFAFSSLLCLIRVFFDYDSKIALPATMITLIGGFIMLFIGVLKVGLMTRYLNFCNRERTDLEDWCLNAINRAQGRASDNVFFNALSRATPGITDDILQSKENMQVISGFMAVGNVYMGKNFFKKYWPVISVIVFLFITIWLIK